MRVARLLRRKDDDLIFRRWRDRILPYLQGGTARLLLAPSNKGESESDRQKRERTTEARANDRVTNLHQLFTGLHCHLLGILRTSLHEDYHRFQWMHTLPSSIRIGWHCVQRVNGLGTGISLRSAPAVRGRRQGQYHDFPHRKLQLVASAERSLFLHHRLELSEHLLRYVYRASDS